VKKPKIKSHADLQAEAITVKKAMMEMPPMPLSEGEKYHLIAMDWWLAWKSYTGYDKVHLEGFDTPNGDEEQIAEKL